MNTLLNTILAQITYTRGALIALFAGLFILAACGGGGAATDVAPTGTGTNVCDTNIFDPACGVEKQAERTSAINTCITAIRTGGSCEVPTAVRDCLNAPFTTEGCGEDVLRASVTIASVQATRTTDCRAGNAGSATCTGAIVNVCGTVSNTIDGVLFTETLCGDAYNARRSTLVTACVNAVEGGATRTDTACASVAVDKEVLDCVIDPLATGCDAESVTEVLEKAEVDIVISQGDRVAFCRGADDFATNPLCENAITTTCDANPFTLTTGASPTNFCTGANDGRAALIMRCSDGDANNNEGCDATIGTGTTTVAECITDPFDATNGCSTNTGFDTTRSDRDTLCTTPATLFDGFCDNYGATGAITTTRNGICNTEATSFHEGCLDRTEAGLALDARKAFIQTCLATPSTDCNVPTSSRAVTVTLCIKNPHRDECKDDLDFAEVKSDRTTLCTDTTDYFDTLCDTYDNIETTRRTRCTVGATSFDAICDGKGYDADRTAGQKAFAKECRTSNNPLCISIKLDDGTTSIAACVNNDANGRPYDSVCLTPVFADEREARSLQCADLILTDKTSSLCTNARANNPCIDNPFGTDRQGEDCDATVYETVRDNRDTYCRGAGRTTGDTLCTGIDDFICDGTQADGDPFVSLCGDTNHARQLAFCTLIGASNDVRCESDATKVCPDNPFNSSFGPNRVNCTEGDTYLPNRLLACGGEISDLPTGGAGLCNDEKLSGAICGTDSNVGTDPFAEICGDPAATMAINFVKDTEEQEFCGATRRTETRAGECAMIYTGLCKGDNLVNPAVGEGLFNCLIYDDPAVVGLRNDFCTTAETSFTDGCEDGTHGDAAGEVNTAREMLAMTCRGNPQATGCDTVVDTGTGRTVADCTNHLTAGDPGDPYQTGCDDIGFKEERMERDLTCALVATLEMPLCANAKSTNACVNDPFGEVTGGGAECDPTDYMAAQTDRDRYCRISTTADDPLCTGRQTYICGGANTDSVPTAGICGDDNELGEQEFCRTNRQTTGTCESQEAVACQANPFNDSFGAYRFDCTDSTYFASRIPTCRGAMNTWAAAGASVDDCSVKEVAGVICGTGNSIGTDAFADICEESTAMMAIDNFDQDTERQQFCGDVPKTDIRVTECEMIYTGLCTGDNLVKESVGHGGFNCLDYDDPDVSDLRNTHCTTPATSFTDGCEDGTHGDAGLVDAARKSLAAICRTTQNAEGCDDHANAGDSGPTVADCSANTAVGDPYQTGCVDNPLFIAEHTTRATFCSTGANVNDDRLCKNAREDDTCIHFPYGKVTDNSADCDPVTYAAARTNRETYCSNSGLSTGLCVNVARALCDGVGDNDNPFSASCDEFNLDNTAAQIKWCEDNSGDFRCSGAAHAGACSERPFSTDVVPLRGENVNCLEDMDAGITAETYAPQRQLFCASGRELDKVRCDTTEIATVVCGKSDDENSNPFAAFCANSANDGLNNDAAARLAVRQGTLDFCENAANSGVGVCERTSLIIADLGRTCTGDGATSITEQCAYTQYAGTQRAFCADKGSLNIFNAGCKDGTHGEVTTARNNECRRTTATPGVIDRDTECPQIVIDLCEVSAFVQKLDNNDLEQGYLCGTNTNNVNYVTAREMTCGNARPEAGDTNETECNAFLTTLCTGNQFDMAVGSQDYNCATDPEFNTYRETQCGASGNGDGTRTNDECKATITRICDEGASLTTAGNGYDCLNSQIAEVKTERRTFCATDSVNTPGCSGVLVDLCSDSNSFSDVAATGTDGTTFDCTMGTTYRPQRRDYCAKGDNDVNGQCPGVIATLCTAGASSLEEVATDVDSNVYNCLTSKVPAVEIARQVFCADNDQTANCNTVLAGFCTGDKSLSSTVDRGDGTNYNCAGNSDQLLINQRQAYCADGDNDDMVADCPAVIAALCETGTSVQTSVPTGTGTFYPCATSTVPAVITARETHCRLGASNSAGLCNGTIASLCLANPFEERDSDGFGTLCVDTEGNKTYENARKEECRAGSEADGQTGKKCEFIKAGICDGDDVGDSPYAAVCGMNNADNQVRFCRLNENGNSNAMGCDGTIITVCDVDNGDPFDSLCPNNNIGDRTARATACLDSNTDKVCSAEVIQCNMAPFGKTPTNEDCNATIYADAQTAFCTDTDNVFNAGCTNEIYSGTEANRRTECLRTGMSILDTGQTKLCPDFVTTACEADAFTKQENGTSDLCMGNNRAQDNTYEKIRLAACNGETGPLPSGNLCRTTALSGMICGDGIAVGEGGVAGTNPFAEICKTGDGNIYFTGLTASQQNACRMDSDADGSGCTTTIEGFCGIPTTPTSDNATTNNLFDTLCDAGYDADRDTACLQERATAGAGNDCTTRSGVKSACAVDPFIGGCTGVDGQDGPTGYLVTYCTTTDIFDARCLEDDISTYGDVKTLRDAYCGGDTATPADGVAAVDQTPAGKCFSREEKICGATEESNPFAKLCGSNTANRMTFCDLASQTGKGQCADSEDLLCPARPFGTNLGTSGTINCKESGTYAITRKDLVDDCLEENPAPENGATCTDAIKACIDNPFSQTAFNGEPCDAAAFINAFLPHCEKTANAWEADCNAYVGQGEVMATRTAICETPATSFRAGCEDGAYAGTARDTAQETLALTCVDTPDADGCTNPVDGVSGTTVAQCSANPFSTALDCFGNNIFEKQRVARINLCTEAANSFNPLCGIFDEVAGTNKDRLGGITMARDTYCRETSDPADIDGNCVDIKDMFCDGADAGDKPHADVCGTDNVANQNKFCRISGKSTESECLGTVATICHVDNGNPFDTICGESSHVDRATRCRQSMLDTPVALPTNATCDSTVTLVCLGNGDTITANPFDTLCGDESYDDDREAACRIGEIGRPACVDTIKKFCGVAGSVEVNKLFNSLCTEGTTYDGDRTTYCTMGDTIFDPKCNDTHGAVTAAREKECFRIGSSTYPNQTCDTIISGACMTNVFKQTTEGTPTNLCTGDNRNSVAYHSLRVTACEGEITNLPDGVPASACNDENLSGAICGDADTLGSKPFAEICSDADGNFNYDVLTAAQQNACRLNGNADDDNCATTIKLTCEGGTRGGDATLADPFDSLCDAGYVSKREELCRPNGGDENNKGCAKTIADFCVSPDNTDDLFDPLCRDAAGVYEKARQVHCLSLTLNEDTTNCGAEGTDDTVLGEFCKTGQNATHCPLREVEIAAFVDTDDWENTTGANGALDSDGTSRLTILESVGADDTFDTNYVRAGADGLDLSVFDGTDATITDGVLMLSEAGTTDAQGSGVAFARINYSAFTSASKVKYYAGILADTDLGGPLVAPPMESLDTKGEVDWDMVISIMIDERAVQKLTGTKLFIHFANKTFQSRNGDSPIDFDTGNFGSKDKFFIDGGFTTAGIVYGTTKLGSNRNTGTHSDGTLTGLIGSKGLVAAFVSDGAGNTNEYVGGFVADNDDVTIDCSVGSNAFNPELCLVASRAALCRDRDNISVTDANCQTAEIRGVICAAQGDFANLADSICDVDMDNNVDYEGLRRQVFCVGTGDQANPFHGLCVGGQYDGARQVSCNGLVVDPPDISMPFGGRTTRPECEAVISKLCLAEPFNSAAGASVIKFDCLNAASDIYVNKRKMEIGLCVNGTQTDKQRPICTNAEVEKITTPCGTDPLDPICAPYAVQYMTQRTERLNTCRDAMRTTSDCANAITTICTANDAPFSDICHDQIDARKAGVGACLGVVRANKQVMESQSGTIQTLPSVCGTTVSNSKTVLDCINDPFNSDCAVDFTRPQNCADNYRETRCQSTFYAASEVVCETSVTSFTAGCLDPANGFVPAGGGDRLHPARNARATLTRRCTDTGEDGMPNTDNDAGCDTVIAVGAKNITFMDCINNPFLTACQEKDAIVFALTNSPAAVEIRTALVMTCEGFDDITEVNASDACKTIVGDGKTIESCTRRPFEAGCSGLLAIAFNSYREPTCLSPSGSFTAGCNEETYEGTDAARAEQALGCADADDKGQNECDMIVEASGLTIDECNETPFAAGCESPAFTNARLEACKGENPNAACSVDGALARTNYVAGDVADLDLGSKSVVVGIEEHTSTLNDVGYAEEDDGVYTDQSASGFALVYIPAVTTGQPSPSRYYAGLLSGTNVGGPLQENSASGAWVGKLAFIIGQGVLETVDFKLDVYFDGRTISASDSVNVDYAETALGNFYIKGRFTDKGVIYGTTRLDNEVMAKSSRGSLTGVIGQNGAVGAFISSGSGNTLGEYAGGFVAAPELNCRTHPLDIRCDIDEAIGASTVGGLQEDACSFGVDSRNNRACDPVFERVCIDDPLDTAKLFSFAEKVMSSSANLDCAQHPVTLALRREACLDNQALDCGNTIHTVCEDNIFDILCDGSGNFDNSRSFACFSNAGKIFTGNNDEIVTNCENLITRQCAKDPFKGICYISGTTSNTYNPARLAKCADHNFNDTTGVCGDKNNLGKVRPPDVFAGLSVNIIGAYCSRLASPADDEYEVCSDKPADYLAWRNAGMATNDGGTPDVAEDDFQFGVVTGYRAASAKDAGLIAGDADGLNLGDGATSVHNELTLTLETATNGVAIASATVGGKLQSYGGLLSGANVGAPVQTGDAIAEWSAQIALLWQDGDNPSQTTLLRNANFSIGLNFSAQDIVFSRTDDISLVNTAGVDSGKISLGITGTTGQKMLGGTVTLEIVDGEEHVGNFRGLIGRDGLLGAFASSTRTGDNAFAGGLVAEDSGNCAADGSGNPFKTSAGCTDAEKRDEVTRCYNERANPVQVGDCPEIRACFENSGSELFGLSSFVPSGGVGVFCSNPVLDGARAIYCLVDNTSHTNCTKIIAGMAVSRAGSGSYSACIGRPFTGTIQECLNALGPVAFAQSRLDIAVGCMTGGKVTAQATGTCERFITSVGSNCANNPFDSSCADIFTEQVRSSTFAELAQTSRLTHCTTAGNEADTLCTGALTHCAVDSPDNRCRTLVTDYCLGAMGREVTDRANACTAVLADTCDVNPFNPAQRCIDEYANARLEFCKGDGTTVTGATLADCKTDGAKTGQDLEICGNGTSGSVTVNTNPFAPVCQDALYNDYHNMLKNAKEAYCGAQDVAFLDASAECAPIVATACGVGGFNPSQATIDVAFNSLCSQDTYDYARLAVCDVNPKAAGCDAFLAIACPAGAVGNLIGCDGNANSTPAKVWTDNVKGILAEDGIPVGDTFSIAGGFVRAGRDGLNLSKFENVQYKITLEDDDDHGVAFTNVRANSSERFAARRYYAGLLLGTNVGGPLVNNSANGVWAGKVRLSAVARTVDEIDFTLKVAFTGNGGTITTQKQTTSHVEDQDIEINVHRTPAHGDAFIGARLNINGTFNAQGVIYGTTDLYFTAANAGNVDFATQKTNRSTSTGTLTGLIGKTGAVGAFYGITGQGNFAGYAGGFVATPDTVGNPYVVGVNCGVGGTPLHATDCPVDDYPDATARAAACLGQRGFTNPSHEYTVCNSAEVADVICAGTGEYANPFHISFCHDYNERVANQLTFANRCNTDSSSADACTEDTYVKACLLNPYDPTVNNTRACNTDLAFANVRTNLESFCGRAGSGSDGRCMDAVETCSAANHESCGNIVQTYCFAEAGRVVAGDGNKTLCATRIENACLNVNPFNDRCADSGAGVYDTTRRDFCSSQTLAELATLGADLATDCRPHAVAICGFYIPYQALSGPKPPDGKGGLGATRADIQEGRVYGTNPYAAICVNSAANPDDGSDRLGTTANPYDRNRQGAKAHAKQVLAYYVREFCPVIPSNNARIDSCPKIDVAGADGYEAWGVAVGQGLISAGDAGSPSVTETTNFIAGYGGGLYLGVGNTNVKNAKTFRLNAGVNGFAYATTGTQLFTGLLSSTTNLGASLGAEIVSAEWRSTLSFLTNQGDGITAIEKEGFILTLNYNGGSSTITGIENVADGMVFQVDGTFTGNLLSGTVTFGATESGTLDSDAFAASGDRTTGRLTGVIGADGAIGVFKSNVGGHFGDFVGGFITAPVTFAGTTTWALSFLEAGQNIPTAVGGETAGQYLVRLLPTDFEIVREGSIPIAGNAGSFIRLNEFNQIQGRETSVVRGETVTNIIQSLSFANNPALITPDNGDSGITFGNIAVPGENSRFVRLAGLFPTTNMGLPLKSQPATAIWRGKMSVIASGKFQGERDVRFMITFDEATVNGVGTIATTERVNIFTELGSEYFSLAINAKFDARGAVYGTTSLQQNRIASNLSLTSSNANTDGRVSGLIGQKGLIGAFVSSYYGGQDPRKEYVGGFYALNPDAPRKVVEEVVLVSGPTSRNLWGDSFNKGAVNGGDNDTPSNPDDDVDNPNVVDAFGAGAPAGHARFARSGADSYIGTDPLAFRSLNFSFDEDSGVGFGKVGGAYYSGLLTGANVGISLSKNQEITGTATWTGKIALYGVGSGTGSAILPESTERDFTLNVTFDGTTGTITGVPTTFGRWFAGNRLDYTLTLTGTFNEAGVISGTTSFYGADPSQGDGIAVNALAVEGEVTGLIGTRGAIGSFISTKVFADEITFAGTYAGGFVVQNPDYTVLPELQVSEQAVLGDDVELTSWATASGASTTTAVGNDGFGGVYFDLPSATHFIQGDASGITNLSATKLELTDVKKKSAGGVAFAVFSGGTTLGVRNVHYFAGLLSTADVGKALLSPPPTAVWEGKIRAVAKGLVLDERDFLLKVSFDGAVGRIWSTDSTGAEGSMASGHPQLVGPGVKPGRFAGNAINIGLTGTFNADGVMTGTVRADDTNTNQTLRYSNGVFNGIIGAKGALGVFKSNTGQPYSYAGGFTAQNPDFGVEGVTADYNLWRVSFNSRGVNRRVSDPTIPGAKLASALQPRGVNVNQFLDGSTHFVQGELNGLNLAGSNLVTGVDFTPTVLKLADTNSGFALWQGNINVSAVLAEDMNTQGYVGLLNGTDVGADPLSSGRTTYTGKIQAYVGSALSDVTDFTLNINYGANRIDAVAELEGTRFQFDGGFNFLGVITGDVLIGEDGIQGSFNGLLGTDSAIGVFKNTATPGNTGGTFIGGFVVSDKFINSPDWAKSFASGGANVGQALLEENGHLGDNAQGAGTHFIRATATTIRGATRASVNLLHLTGDSSDGGVAFVQELSGTTHQVGYAGLLSTTNVGLPLENDDLNGVWNGAIQAYVGETLAKSGFNLTVNYTDTDVDGTVTLGGKDFTFDGEFTNKGIISGDVSVAAESGVQGSFNGLIGVLGAVGAFKDNGGTAGRFVGGFVVTPVLDTDGTVDFDAWANSGVADLKPQGFARGGAGKSTDTFFIKASATGIQGNAVVFNNLTLGSDLASGGVVFGRRTDPNSAAKTYYTGLLNGTDVGRHIDNENLNAIWKGRIRSYVSDGTNLGDEVDFYLDVEFGASGLTGNQVGKVESTSAAGAKGPVALGNGIGTIHINGTFNAAGVMSGAATHLPVANGVPVSSPGFFNGIIGTTAAVGVFKDNGSGGPTDSFAGGFVVKPTE